MPEEKLLKQILAELQAIRRNQEAQMPEGLAEQAHMSRVPRDAPPQDEGERARRKIAGLRSKGG